MSIVDEKNKKGSKATMPTTMIDRSPAVGDTGTLGIVAPTPTFKEDSVTSLHLVMAMVESLFLGIVWSRRLIVTHSPASNYEIDNVLQVLRRKSSVVGDHLKIDSSNIKKHPEF
jgi:hypothetical protein